MDLKAYHNALYMGFSEREAQRIGEEAWEDNILMEIHAKRNRRDQEPELPMCDVCGKCRAVAVANDKYVCSEECCYRAEEIICGICGKKYAVTVTNGVYVCSEECDHKARENR